MDETTPLLAGSSDASHTPLVRLAAYNRPTPQVGSGAASTEQSSLFEDNAISNLDARPEDLPPPENFQQETNDEVSLIKVVPALRSAWQQSRKPKSEITLNFFSTWELYSMHIAWRRVTRGKRCNYEAHRIAEALAAAMAIAILPQSPSPSENLSFVSWTLKFHADKNLLAANLLREWTRITEGNDLDNFTISSDSDFQPLSESERVEGFWPRLAQLWATILPLILHFRFQILLHGLLVIWPISILIVATKYWACPIAYQLLYVLMILGSAGCLAVSIRMALILLTRRSRDAEFMSWGWNILKWTEFGFLIVFIIQAYLFFSENPPSEPGPHQCLKKFYSANLKTNYVSIAILPPYLLVYFRKICAYRSRA